MSVCAELQGMSVPGDCLAWINGCEVLGQRVLAELVARGRGAGMAMVLGTASTAVAQRLAAEVNVLVASGAIDPALAGQFASVRPNGANVTPGGGPGTEAASTSESVTAGPAGPAGDLAFGRNGGSPFPAGTPPLGTGAFALLSRAPQRRVLARCRHVSAAGAGSSAWRPE
jgi:hypothetical protein